MTLPPSQRMKKPDGVHESNGAPPCTPQCSGASVADMLSKLLKAVAPNSLVKVPLRCGPMSYAG